MWILIWSPRRRSKMPTLTLRVAFEELRHPELLRMRRRDVAGLRVPVHVLVVVVAQDRQRDAHALERSGVEVAVAFAEHARVRLHVRGRDALATVERSAQVLDPLAALQEVRIGHAPARRR